MQLSNKLRLYLSIFFLAVLALNLIFFMIIRIEFFTLYQEVLNLLITVLSWIRIEVSVNVLEAYVILSGFLISSLAASGLLYLGMQLFRTQEVIHQTVLDHAFGMLKQESEHEKN